MDLTKENYHSTINNNKYMSFTQFKQFLDCEASAMAIITGEWQEPCTTAMLVGAYVDAYFSGELEQFKCEKPEIFKRDGELKSDYLQANIIIDRIRASEAMMKYLTGDMQVTMTGEIAGVPFKIRMDSYKPGEFICDLKVMRDFKNVWQDGEKKNFVEAWGYDYQAAIYREIEGNNLPFIIAAAAGKTAGSVVDIELMYIPDDVLCDRIATVRELAPMFQMIKLGLKEPGRCGKCDFCKATKVLGEPVDYREVGE